MYDPQTITDWTVGQLAWHLQAIHMRLLWGSTPQGEPPYAIQIHQAATSSPLREEIALLCRAANGEIARDDASEQQLAELADTIQGIVEVTAAPALLASYTIEEGYWATPIGELIAAAQLWLRGDDLISYAEAARLLWPGESEIEDMRRLEQRTIARVRRMAERGELRRYRNVAPDGDARGPWLLSRQEVAAHLASRLAEEN